MAQYNSAYVFHFHIRKKIKQKCIETDLFHAGKNDFTLIQSDHNLLAHCTEKSAHH